MTKSSIRRRHRIDPGKDGDQSSASNTKIEMPLSSLAKHSIFQHDFMFQRQFHEYWKKWCNALDDILSRKLVQNESVNHCEQMSNSLEKDADKKQSITERNGIPNSRDCDRNITFSTLDVEHNNEYDNQITLVPLTTITNAKVIKASKPSLLPKMTLPPPPPFPSVKKPSPSSIDITIPTTLHPGPPNDSQQQSDNPFDTTQDRWQNDKEKLKKALGALKSAPNVQVDSSNSNVTENKNDHSITTKSENHSDHLVTNSTPPSIQKESLPVLLFSPILEKPSLDKLDAMSIIYSQQPIVSISDDVQKQESLPSPINHPINKPLEATAQNVSSINTPSNSQKNTIKKSQFTFHIPSPKIKASVIPSQLDNVKLSPAASSKTLSSEANSMKRKVLTITAKDKSHIKTLEIKQSKETTISTTNINQLSDSIQPKKQPFIASGSSNNYRQHLVISKHGSSSTMVNSTPKKLQKPITTLDSLPKTTPSNKLKQIPPNSSRQQTIVNQSKHPVSMLSPFKKPLITNTSSKASLPEINSEDEDDNFQTLSKNQPYWAQRSVLQTTLEMQSRVNPDDIFGNSVPKIETEKVFYERYSSTKTTPLRSVLKENNSSSQKQVDEEGWSFGPDEITPRQIKLYNQQMGYE